MKPQPKPTNSKIEETLRATVRSASSIAHHRIILADMSSQSCTHNMSDCYERLQNMVPYMPADRRVSKVELLQNVIDYIQDLQTALENQTTNRRNASANRANRTPLSTISLNNKSKKV